MPALARDYDPASADALEHLQRLCAATLHLMSTHAGSGPSHCPYLAEVISRHLQALSRADLASSLLRATCNELAGAWQLRASVPAHCPRQPWWLRAIEPGPGTR